MMTTIAVLVRWSKQNIQSRIIIRPEQLVCLQWISSVQFSRSVVSDSLRPHESQHTRPPCPSPTPGVYSNSCPSSRWYHPAISSSVVHFSSCPQPSQHQGLSQWVNSSHEVAISISKHLQTVDTKLNNTLRNFNEFMVPWCGKYIQSTKYFKKILVLSAI